MAIFGNIDILKKQLKDKKFDMAFKYLERVLKENTEDNKRLISLPLGAFEKVDLDDNNFALEQAYNSKERKDCFFESHKKYIDVQFILEGEEIIEIDNIDNLDITFVYDKNLDLIKYDDSKSPSILKLKKGDIAIFYPEDAHMPCVKINKSIKVVKTVVKVLV